MLSLLTCLIISSLLSNLHALALSIPQPDLIYLSGIPAARNLTWSDASFGVCFPPSSLLPSFTDCETLVENNVPRSEDRVTFHSGFPKDELELPRIRVYGSCRIKVVIGGTDESSRVVSSWSDIHRGAEDINELCRNGDYSGGKIRVGQGEKIWISLGKRGT